MRVALVHDWLNQYGGAERVLEVLHDLFPEAPIYTAFYDPSALPEHYRRWDIRTTGLQRVPFATRYHQLLLPLYPLAFESLDLSAYDVVLSNSSGFCHGVITPPGTVHINYCLTPPRYLWSPEQYLRRERVPAILRSLLLPVLSSLRTWDATAALRVDHFIGISRVVVERIRKFYRREAALIYPPVETQRFQPAPPEEVGDYYLVLGRLVPYKRVDLAVAACTRLGLPLVVAGEGRDRRALEAMAGPTVRFLGHVPQQEADRLLARCRALIFPGEEDFGIVPIEAQASGRPVIAYAGGGALDTVQDEVTGVLFAEQSVESLIDALQRFQRLSFDPSVLRENALRFDVSIFREKLRDFVVRKAERRPHEPP